MLHLFRGGTAPGHVRTTRRPKQRGAEPLGHGADDGQGPDEPEESVTGRTMARVRTSRRSRSRGGRWPEGQDRPDRRPDARPTAGLGLPARGLDRRRGDPRPPPADRPTGPPRPAADEGQEPAVRTTPSPGRSSSAPSSARSSCARVPLAPVAARSASPRPRPSASSSGSSPSGPRWPPSASSRTGCQAGSRCGSRKWGAHLTTQSVNQRGRDQPRPCASVRRVSRTRTTMRLTPGRGKTGLDLHP